MKNEREEKIQKKFRKSGGGGGALSSTCLTCHNARKIRNHYALITKETMQRYFFIASEKAGTGLVYHLNIQFLIISVAIVSALLLGCTLASFWHPCKQEVPFSNAKHAKEICDISSLIVLPVVFFHHLIHDKLIIFLYVRIKRSGSGGVYTQKKQKHRKRQFGVDKINKGHLQSVAKSQRLDGCSYSFG